MAAPEHTAVVIIEMQRGVVGDCAGPMLAPLTTAVESHQIASRLAELADAARRSGIRVVHAVARFRADWATTPINNPTFAVHRKIDPNRIVEGTPGAEVIAQLTPQPADIVSVRQHGMSAFTGTDLDAALRALGVRTVVIGGVSLNLGVPGTANEAINLGYKIAVVRDGVIGVPTEYGEQVLQHTLRPLGPTPTTAELVAAWGGAE
nr:isochorismatase family cysteine hydrolase [Leucobacter exalbidus]